MEHLYKLLEKLHIGSRKERRLHPREACSIETGYMIQNRWYRGHILDIGPGGVYVEAMQSRVFSPGMDILLVAKIQVLREQLKGRIAWVGMYGMGVKFQLPELAPVPDDSLATHKASKSMGKIKTRKIRWEPSTTPNVKYRLYWCIGGGVDYHSDHSDLGNATEINLPGDIPSFPLVSGTFQLGISAISEAGNESELTKTTVQVDFTVPEAPKSLTVEDL
jgi:hypothetical protein